MDTPVDITDRLDTRKPHAFLPGPSTGGREHTLLTRHFLVLWLGVAAVLIGCWLVLMRTRFVGVIGKNPFAAFAGLFVVSYLLLLVILIPWHAHLIWRDNPNIVGPWGVMRPYVNAMACW